MDLSNTFLVSMPTLRDSSFSKSVIYLNEFSDKGANGWILNKQLDDHISVKLRKGMGLQKPVPIFYGGPVDISSGVIIHSNDLHLPSSVALNDELSMTRDKAIINIFNIGQFPEYWRVIVGHSSWMPQQLNDEIEIRNSWFNIPYTKDIMWNTQPVNQWDACVDTNSQNMTNDILKFTF